MRSLILLILVYGLSLTSALAESGVLTINWQEVNKLQAQVSARRTPYPSVLMTGIKNTALPVLLPASHAYDQNMSIVADKNFYMLSVFLDGAMLIISGDKSYQQSMNQDAQAQAIQKATQTLRFIRAEGMMSTDFNRYGANYSLVVECDKPDVDQRCLQDGFLKNRYQELILVGGHP